MVEYGNGISKGPAGQVAGSGGASHPLAVGGDPFATIGRVANDGWSWLTHLTTIEMVVVGVVVIVGLLVLRRVF